VEQGGRIRIVKDGTLQPAPFLDVSDRISSGGERGLLGLAFHPGFPADPRLFVDYTDPNGDTQVSSFAVNPASPDRADPGSEVKILRVQQPYANHNGGAVVFGPDGKLFISFGDGGSEGDPQGSGQNPRTLLGKILRIDVDSRSGDRQYAIPPDNPFADGAGGAPEIWLTGLRNPWRISFDRATGDLWIGDVGQSAWEEIDYVARARLGTVLDFGWAVYEGDSGYDSSRTLDPRGPYVRPVEVYSHDEGCSVTGGFVYRGKGAPALAGRYFYGDYCSGTVWTLKIVDGKATDVRRESYRIPGLTSFGEDARGGLYAVNEGGTVFRIAS
jgi:glucose/arabinose dehydrogenase